MPPARSSAIIACLRQPPPQRSQRPASPPPGRLVQDESAITRYNPHSGDRFSSTNFMRSATGASSRMLAFGRTPHKVLYVIPWSDQRVVSDQRADGVLHLRACDPRRILLRGDLADCHGPTAIASGRFAACRRCGYNLNKNTSGLCPECGTPVIEDPDLVVPGRLTCCLCGKLLGWEDREGNGKGDGVLITPPARLPESEPMRKYVNVQMHRGCWNQWMHRRRFVEVVNASPNSGWRVDEQGRAVQVEAATSGGAATG
jgi:hypothetical protein